MKKRGWSLFLALALCLSLLTATAWAEGDEGAQVPEISGKWTDEGNYDTSWYDASKDEFTISTAAQLAGLAQLVNGGTNFSGKTIYLGADIVLNEDGGTKNWTPIGNSNTKQFQGTFDGQGNTVSKLYININNSSSSIIPARVGLFGYVGTSGKVQNLNVTGEVTVSSGGSVYTGGVVGDTNGATVENCSFSGTVKGESSRNNSISAVGGVVGSADSTAVKNCSNAGTVTASTSTSASIYAGGVVGYMSTASGATQGPTVENCYNTGTVLSTGSVSGNQGAGGVVGDVSSGDVNNCYNTGTVSAQSASGTSLAGGVAGYASSATVRNCYNTGKVTASATDVSGTSYAGGVVGDTNGATVRNCYNTGEVTASATNASGTSYAGGVAGRFFSKTEVSSCYNTGKVTATNTQATAKKNFAGGITGYMESSITGDSPTVTNCYFQKGENESLNASGGQASLNTTPTPTVTNVESKSSEAFASGEVAHLLQGEQIDAVWGQANGSPALLALNASAQTVYKVTFETSGEDSAESLTYKYVVAGGTVAEIPTAPNNCVWYVDNQEFTASTAITGNLTVTAKAKQNAPTAPALASRTTSSITLKEVAVNNNNAAAQYGISTDGGTTWTWQTSPEFTNLASGTEYTFALRYGGTDSHAPSPASETAAFSTTRPSSSSTPTYPPTVEDTDNGTAAVTPARPKRGSTVTVTPKPETGYETASVTVTDSKGNPVAVTDNGDGTYSFTQPAGKVTISVAYACDGLTDHCPSYHFADVDTSAWYHEATDYMVTHGLMTGTAPDTFSPDSATTRAMVVTILYRLEGEPSTSGSTAFTDVDSGTWYTDPIAWAAANGVVTGTSPTTFDPDAPVTREQMAAILYRYLAAKGYDVTAQADLSGYTDAGQISPYATETMSWANALGFLTGETPTTLVPQGNATRAQVAEILMRYCITTEL